VTGSSRPSTEGDRPLALTAFQIEVSRTFFALPASRGFLLAGGAALAAHDLTQRPTRDLDIFTAPGAGDVGLARDAFEATGKETGWTVSRLRDEATFCRLLVIGPEELLIDLALDSKPGRPSTASIAGPTFDPAELAGRKVLALFDRAEARDFTDVHALAERFGKAELLALAAEVDRGFDRRVFVQMLATLDRFSDDDLPVPALAVVAVRAFFRAWARELAQAPGL